MRLNLWWSKYQSRHYFFKLLNIINNNINIKLSSEWCNTIKRASILVGRSISSKDISYAFLQNMIVIEMLLTEQGDKYSDVLPERIESFIGWTGYWKTNDYSNKIKYLYKLRCEIVHDGKYDNIKVEDLLFSDEIIFNLFNNMIRNINIFKSKKDLISFSKKVQAEHILGINSKVRPKTLSFTQKSYDKKDLEEII